MITVATINKGLDKLEASIEAGEHVLTEEEAEGYVKAIHDIRNFIVNEQE